VVIDNLSLRMSKMLIRLKPHLISLVVILGVVCIYFLPQIQGKVIQAGDSVSYEGMAKEINDFKAETGEQSWWTNSMFGGMPAYQIMSSQPSNLLKYPYRLSQLFIDEPIGYFFTMAFVFYLLLLYLKVNPWLSIIGGLSFSLATGNMLLLEAGHFAKLRAIAFFPLIIIGMIAAYKKEYIKGGLIFGLGVGLNLLANHIQMTYYFFFGMFGLGLYFLYQTIKSKDWDTFLKATAVIFVAGLIGIGSSASKLWSTYEYSKDTMRGDPVLVSENGSASANSSSETKGLDWNYAMQWSNGLLDLASSVIPGVAGGSSGELVGKDSKLYQDLKRKGANLGNEFRSPMYHGSLGSTGGPFYLGAIICFLFILGAFVVKSKLKWWLIFTTLFLLLLSMGQNFSLLNKLLFDYFPLFNKFRTPNSVLTVAGFFLTILGVLSVSEILSGKVNKEDAIKGLKISLGITGGFCLFYAVLGPSVVDLAGPNDARLEQSGYNLQALFEDRGNLMRSDSIRSLLLILAAGGLIWAILEKKIKEPIFLGALGILTIGDFWTVDKRYVNDGSFVNDRKYQSNFVPRAVDTQILKDPALHYRVLDLSINTFSSSSSSYFHNTIGGYHAAKLQRYSDIIDRYLSKGDQGVLGMLNTKYVIGQDQKLQSFPAFGNAWFVDNVKNVSSANEEIAALKGLDLKRTAVVHQEFSEKITGIGANGGGSIELVDYKPNYLKYQASNVSQTALAIFSEIWYGPNKGWEAYVDGQEVDIIRANYLLRGLKIPSGDHSIEFKFNPSSFYSGERISLICSLLLLGGFIFFFGKEELNRQKSPKSQPAKEAKKSTKKKG